MSREVRVLGGGLAGAAAAIAATRAGARVRLFEPSTFPRHKVCGEFLSPEVEPLLESLGLWERFQALSPVAYRQFTAVFATGRRTAVLSRPAWGLSRYALDALLMDAVREAGVEVIRQRGTPEGASPVVVAYGRTGAAQRGDRLFGFKAHFRGPFRPGVTLHFFEGGYLGVNEVEGGHLNVCGLARESLLAPNRFDPGLTLRNVPEFGRLLPTLNQEMKWMITGPLEFRQQFTDPGSGVDVYMAGDALSFVDPFTGTGMAGALLTGISAGLAAAEGLAASEHLRRCKTALRMPFRVSSLIRGSLATRWPQRFLPLLPLRLLVQSTRPAWRGVRHWLTQAPAA